MNQPPPMFVVDTPPGHNYGNYCKIYWLTYLNILAANLKLPRNTPTTVLCKNCHKTVPTKIKYEIGTGTWICCIPGLGIPFLCDACKDGTHFCTACGSFVGRTKFLLD